MACVTEPHLSKPANVGLQKIKTWNRAVSKATLAIGGVFLIQCTLAIKFESYFGNWSFNLHVLTDILAGFAFMSLTIFSMAIFIIGNWSWNNRSTFDVRRLDFVDRDTDSYIIVSCFFTLSCKAWLAIESMSVHSIHCLVLYIWDTISIGILSLIPENFLIIWGGVLLDANRIGKLLFKACAGINIARHFFPAEVPGLAIIISLTPGIYITHGQALSLIWPDNTRSTSHVPSALHMVGARLTHFSAFTSIGFRIADSWQALVSVGALSPIVQFLLRSLFSSADIAGKFIVDLRLFFTCSPITKLHVGVDPCVVFFLHVASSLHQRFRLGWTFSNFYFWNRVVRWMLVAFLFCL